MKLFRGGPAWQTLRSRSAQTQTMSLSSTKRKCPSTWCVERIQKVMMGQALNKAAVTHRLEENSRSMVSCSIYRFQLAQPVWYELRAIGFGRTARNLCKLLYQKCRAMLNLCFMRWASAGLLEIYASFYIRSAEPCWTYASCNRLRQDC